MQSLRRHVIERIKRPKGWAGRLLFPFLVVALVLPSIESVPSVLASSEAPDNSSVAADFLDKIIFGDTASESDHRFQGEFTTSITGLFGEPARVSNPRDPVEGQGGDLTFTMKVDPYLRNYFTVKFSGEEASSVSMVNINGEQVGYISNGDYEAINKGWMLPNRFFYNTIMLPLESTAGKETVEITIKSFNPWGNMTSDTRGYYSAYTHTQAYIDVEGEQQGYKFKPGQSPETMLPPDLADAEKQALFDSYRQDHINLFNSLSNKVDGSGSGKMSIIRYQDELMFYASALKYDWSPAKTPEAKKAALQRIFKSIDNHVKDYYGNTRLVLRGGHQGDWGGYYGALGEALYIVENLIQDDSIYGKAAFNAFLDEPFVTGTAAGEYSLEGVDWEGGDLTRREAWERVLKANFDFARARLSYIYNQVYYSYVGAWEAHEGLRIIGSDFYEGRERSQRILLESLGIRPFLGEEVLVGPNGEELDLYHSLFYHDGNAVFTDDFVHIVGKGLAKSKLDAEGRVVRRLPYGKHYTGLTEAGLTRENGYVANYGESANYLVSYYYKTLDHVEDKNMNDEFLKAALKSAHARGFVRYSSLDDNGKRIMRAEQVTDERNQGLTGMPSYTARIGLGMGMQFASLEMTMAQNEARYAGSEWEEYWEYAKEAVGYVQQQLADRQLLHTKDFGHRGTMSGPDFRLAETYDYVTAGRAEYERFGGDTMAGVVLPQTDFDYYLPEELSALGIDPQDYEQLAWADIDNMYVSVRDGDFRMLGSLFYRNRGMASNGRLHIMTDRYDHVVQIATNNVFRYEDYYLRASNIDWDFQSDRASNWSGAPQALAGEPAPISYQPGVGVVNRDNFEADTPYSGYPELQTSRYGKYFIIFNTTRDEYGNKQTFEVDVPADFSGASVLDLISGTNIPVVGGKVSVAPKTAMVLKLTSDFELAPKPYHVDFVNALAGNGYVGVSWKTTSGGRTYTIKRSESEEGPYEPIATDVQGNFYKDANVQAGKAYYYKIAAVNEHGAGWDSWRAKVDLTVPESVHGESVWRDDRLGGTSGSAVIDGSSILIKNADGTGLGQGDDYNIYKRDIIDSLHYVSQVTAGNSSISARIDGASGEASGIMMRDRTTAEKARYIYFGADEKGNLILQSRTRNSFHHWWNETASPYDAKIKGYTVAEYPYVKLVRDHDSQTAYAFVSKDGSSWTYVTKLSVLLTYAYHTGVVASDDASFSEVTVTQNPQGHVYPFIVKQQDQITLYWSKPKQASWFHLYRTTDEAAGQSDPELKPGTTEPIDGSPWTLVRSGTRKTTYEETNLRYGKVHYRILPIHADCSQQPFFAASVSADSIEEVMRQAESLSASEYTKASYYLFREELDRIKAEMAKPDRDEAALIADIYKARQLLVPYPVSLYSFEGNADNSYGSSSGTVAGSAEYTGGKVGQAIALNGADSYVALPGNDQRAGGENITVAAWVYWNRGSQWQRIFDFGNNTNQYLFLTPRSGNNTLRFAIKNGGGEQLVETAQLAASEWAHIAVTLGGGTAKLYVNGELKAEKSNMTIKPSDIRPVNNYIGKSQFADPLFAGRIDEFRVYDSVLSGDEIRAVYEKTSSWYDDSLLAYLLEEASKVQEECCIEESYLALQTAIAQANAIAAAEHSTQEDLDAASADLQTALQSLERRGITAVVDPAAPNGNNGWYTSPVTIALSPESNAEYSLDGGNEWKAYKEPVVISKEGRHRFLYRSAEDTSEEETIEVNLDLTAPELRIQGEALYTIDQIITITCSATDVISSIYGAPCNEPLLQTPAYRLDPGEHRVTVTAEDQAGLLTTETHTFAVKPTFDSLKNVTNAFLQETGDQAWEHVAKAYNQKLEQAQSKAASGKLEAAIGIMNGFIGQVRGHAGKFFTDEQAQILIRWATNDELIGM